MTTDSQRQDAYRYCRQLAQSHYENFPVASLLLPKALRQPISVIYAFARNADDIADEGHYSASHRLAQLDHYEQQLIAASQQAYHGDDPVFIALQDVMQRFQLPSQLFSDLLTAFRQDVEKDHYQNYTDLLNYCQYSANPVGRLLLHLNDQAQPYWLQQSDAICTALQLINIYQDIQQDYQQRQRSYLPQDELDAAHLRLDDIIQSNNSQHLAPLLRDLYQRASQLMQQGYLLGSALAGRLGWEIRAITLAGIYSLSLLVRQDDRHLLSRPHIKKSTLLQLMLISLNRATYRRHCQRLLKKISGVEKHYP